MDKKISLLKVASYVTLLIPYIIKSKLPADLLTPSTISGSFALLAISIILYGIVIKLQKDKLYLIKTKQEILLYAVMAIVIFIQLILYFK